MFGTTVADGFLFYGKTRRRRAVAFDTELRVLTAHTATEVQRLIVEGRTPLPVYEARKCKACSLKAECHPERLAKRVSVSRWLAARIKE